LIAADVAERKSIVIYELGNASAGLSRACHLVIWHWVGACLTKQP